MNPLEQDLQDLENGLRSIGPSSLTPELKDRIYTQLFGANLAEHKPVELSDGQLDSYEDIIIESELNALLPRALDKSFLDQLENIPAESALSELNPSSLSDNFLNRIVHKLDNLETEEENVIPFPTNPKAQSKNWKWYASAAVAACIGIFCGLSLTKQESPTYADVAPINSFQSLYSDNLQNISTESTLIRAENRGIIAAPTLDQAPHRAVRVIEMETQVLKSHSGDIIIKQRPVEKIIRIPVEAD